MGIEYGRGCLATAIDRGCALATNAVRKMFPESDWQIITAEPFDAAECARDRFGENFKIQREIYKNTPTERHILIGGDHSVNFGHFAAIADQMPDSELCLVYIDAHLDMHSPDSAVAQASGAPHGCNVRALLGTGDERWLGLQSKMPALKPENVFFLATRSFEDAEINFVHENNIFYRTAEQLQTCGDLENAVREIRERIAGRPFVLSIDFDSISPEYFTEVLVPAPGGLSADAAEFLINEFRDAHSVEFVEYAPSGDAESAKIVEKLIRVVAK